MNPHIQSVLVDARNWAGLKDQLIAEVADAGITGFDIETQDADRHQGLNDFMSGNSKKLVFDVNRQVVTGFSWYCDGSDTGYYLNLAHADVENRISWDEARQILDARPHDAHTICHNAPFELTMMQKALGFDLGPNVICTLQMAVSTFNEDQYPIDDMLSCGFGGISNLLHPIGRAFASFDRDNMTEEQGELMSKVLAKQSVAKHSYNGLVRDLKYGYGLKALVKKFFGYEQASFQDTLNGKKHMGELTGEEVVAYGVDDAYWAVRLFHKFLPMMMAQNDQLLTTFFEQENPMIYVFSEIWSQGLLLDMDAVAEAVLRERQTYADAVRRLHAKLREMLPYPEALNEGLLHDSWYKKNPHGYRKKITDWALKDLPDDDFEAVMTTGGPVSQAWARDNGRPKSDGPNLSYYMTVRSILYDLTGARPRFKDGKIASDKDARDRLRGKGIDDLLDIFSDLGRIEQTFKLYLTPYRQLVDPDTGRVYPVVSSKLNSRRMGMSDPNGMQLTKDGPIRSFYRADDDDHVIISLDWSQVELVLIGELSGDPAFAQAYGQLPYQDLHIKAAAGALGVTEEELAADPDVKEKRRRIGKPANFGYWYSGALGTVVDTAGWSADEMWAATEMYRQTFAVAEQWRVDLINESRMNGFVTLPDGHRRHRFEATYRWQQIWQERWASTKHPGLINFGQLFVNRITNRAGNQIVNSMIQGSCATLAKRSILAIRKRCQGEGLRVKFMMPIHDELVYSVHHEDALRFLQVAREGMCTHPGIVDDLVLDATASMGRNFGAISEENPFGQIELDEAPAILGFKKGSKLTQAETSKVLDYLMGGDQCLAGAA